jgi:hypothetical protein
MKSTGERNLPKAKARKGRASGRERVHIRQQLQGCWHTATVRDAKLLIHVGSGAWRLP